MKTVTIEELEQVHDKNFCVIDIRPAEQFSWGTFPGAVNIPADRLEELLEEEGEDQLERLFEKEPSGQLVELTENVTEAGKTRVLKNMTIYVLCHTGERSRSCVELLEEAGYDGVNIEGGYRAYLKLSLSRYMEQESEEKRQEKQAEIERSIIKKFRKTIWRPFTKALHEYQLIQEGDKIAVCISGGKDSMLLAKLIQELDRKSVV